MTESTPGVIRNCIFIKRIHEKNILRMPELSFTFDKATYDKVRPQFNTVRVIIYETSEVYELPAGVFDQLRVNYNYGRGASYLVPIRKWKHLSKQLSL